MFVSSNDPYHDLSLLILYYIVINIEIMYRLIKVHKYKNSPKM